MSLWLNSKPGQRYLNLPTPALYPLLYILDLLTHLFDQHLQLHRGLRSGNVRRFRTQGISLPIQFLHQEIKPPANRLFTGENFVQFFQTFSLTVQQVLAQRNHLIINKVW